MGLRFFTAFILIMVFLWVAGYALFAASILYERPNDESVKTEAIIVLTGGDFRIETGFDLFAQKRSPNLFISGVHDTVSLDDIIKKWDGLDDGSRALPACCMELGHKALTTTENAEESKEWVEKKSIKSIRLVTSPYHMPRAFLEFRSVMPDLEIIPHRAEREALGPKDWFFWHITFIEYHKWAFRYLLLSVLPS